MYDFSRIENQRLNFDLSFGFSIFDKVFLQLKNESLVSPMLFRYRNSLKVLQVFYFCEQLYFLTFWFYESNMSNTLVIFIL